MHNYVNQELTTHFHTQIQIFFKKYYFHKINKANKNDLLEQRKQRNLKNRSKNYKKSIEKG